ncbi:MAG: GNAT family N-acetyltransferase [Gammaproteobacteria bacterium]|nr:GNAT family N-acetyltransferase [Gammaproteobacteria bacterium]
MPGYHTESCIIKHANDIKEPWLDLQSRADSSYFQSWGWIQAWLQQIAFDLQPVAVKVWCDGRLVGIGLFVSRDIKRRVFFRARAMYLNEYPFDGRNMVIEYNGLLTDREHEEASYIETVNHLLSEYKSYDEYVFGAIDEDSSPFNSEPSLVEHVNYILYEESASWSVDLMGFEPGIDSYLACLSRNRRGQIRRSIRLYEKNGELQIDEAENVRQAMFYFEQLKKLHSDYWQSKGKGGSFANPLWERFHLALIKERFDADEIQLLKVSSQIGEIGYIYNVVLDKHVYVIQTGFNRSLDKRLMPGYVAHALAIVYNRSKGMLIYDLMHGESLYKHILCNRSRKLRWIVIQRKRLKFSIENFTVGLVRSLRGLCSPKT